MIFTLKQSKLIQKYFNKILERGYLDGNSGICADIDRQYMNAGKHNSNMYIAMQRLADSKRAYQDGFGEYGTLNDLRVNFLILFTTISANELLEMINIKEIYNA